VIDHRWVKDDSQATKNIENTENNIFVVSIDHEDTNTQSFGKYRYDVQINYIRIGVQNPPVQILTIIKPSIFSIQEEVTLEGVT
jgi:hypothetical protein